MTIAVLYICTGKYNVFWEGFFTSCEAYFIPEAEKSYFVFTDDTDLPFRDHPRVKVIFQRGLGWPKDTLMRFHIFQGITHELETFDHIFFFNANTAFVRPVKAEEILAGPEHEGLVMVTHPGYYDKPVHRRPFEKYRLRSTAYLPVRRRKIYVQGCLSGGTGAAYLQMVRELSQNIETDLSKGIIAEWHDESHLNHYAACHTPRILSPAYAFQEGVDQPFAPAILMRDKARFGGIAQLRKVAPTKKRKPLERIWRALVDILRL